MSMRITLLSCAVLALTTTAAAAQTTQGEPWQPRTTIGVGLGQFSSLFSTNRPTNVLDSTALARVLAQESVDFFRPIRSITVEIPLSDSGRIRIEGSRTAMPIVPRGRWEASTQRDTAHLQRLTISAVRLWQPGEPVLPYVGLGVGLQRARFDVAPESQRGVVGHLHFGVDVRVSDRLTLGAEAGLSGTGKDPWFHQADLTGEGVIRLKIGL
jgi:opacity protein-like surface antigen